MKIKIFFITLIFLILPCNFVSAVVPRTISFYGVSATGAPLKIDGLLDESCWQKADKATTFYEYWKPDPGPGVLKTEFRMLYDEKGIYLGIINYDENVENIRAAITKRDDPGLWQDDCAEIYFDPEAKGVGYLKFITNFLGAKLDLKRIDVALSNIISWNAEGWEYKTSKGKDYWIIEVFFPWSDLGEKANPGDIWMFGHVRYAYSTGKFRGVTWSPGGNYMSPQNFGYIYFEGKERVGAERIGQVLSEIIPPPWELPLLEKDGFLICLEKGKASFLSSEQLMSQSKKGVETWIGKTNNTLSRAKENIRTKFKDDFKKTEREFMALDLRISSPLEAKEKIKILREMENRMEEIYWEIMIAQILEEV